MNIVEEIGLPAVLEQTAEECMEFGHACLKLARKMRGENPTPAQSIDILKNICEEAADVDVCIHALIREHVILTDEFYSIIRDKAARWETRINEMKNKEKGE